ncbi:hypothetical protein DUI87_18949 [Hirundo rustica rustica]|uniref:Reverse transcriptase domain-containing protein n=1 Tax=Hirundo rustica rustica TaxID=333673 RepID=A0A3M0JTY3_HIRRU|nr:hypothetical protein DUI87_18949 [Hirundo rustica rustica]
MQHSSWGLTRAEQSRAEQSRAEQSRAEQSRAEGQNPLPGPAAHTALDVAQDTFGSLGCEGLWLGYVQPLIRDTPKFSPAGLLSVPLSPAYVDTEDCPNPAFAFPVKLFVPQPMGSDSLPNPTSGVTGHLELGGWLGLNHNTYYGFLEGTNDRGAMLDHVLADKKGLEENVKLKHSLGSRDHEMVKFEYTSCKIIAVMWSESPLDIGIYTIMLSLIKSVLANKRSLEMSEETGGWPVRHPSTRRAESQIQATTACQSDLSTQQTMEQIILDMITWHTQNNQVIRPTQNRFRKGRSCLTKLISIYDQVTCLADEGKAVELAYLDSSKAFDIVSHSILLEKLAAHGVDSCTLCWIAQAQRVVRNGASNGASSV